MSENDFFSIGPKIKGEVHLQAHDADGNLVFEHEQPNMWLDNGSRIFAAAWSGASYNANPYLVLSSNTVQPSYGNSSIPNVLTSQQVVGSSNASLKRWQFQFTFLAIPAGRNIRTIGISYNSDGGNAYCYTVLTTPYFQDASTSVTVTYYVYYMDSGINYGYGNTINSLFFSRMFAAQSRQRYTVMYNGTVCGPAQNDEYINVGFNEHFGRHAANINTSAPSFNSTYFRYSNGYSLGSGTELNTWTSWGWTGIAIEQIGPVAGFPFSTLGRVWGKQNRHVSGAETGVGDYHAAAWPTVGNMKGFQVRAKSNPYNPKILRRNRAIFYPITGPNIGDTCSLENMKYVFVTYDMIVHLNELLSFTSGQQVLYTAMEVFYNKFLGRDFIALSARGQNTSDSYIKLASMTSGGTIGGKSIDNNSHYFLWENESSFNNSLYAIRVGDPNKGWNEKDIYKWHTETGSFNDRVVTKVATTPFNVIHGVFNHNSKKFLLHYRDNGAIGYFDPADNTISETWWKPGNMILGKAALSDWYRSWGDYDEVKNRIIFMQDNSMLIGSPDGDKDENGFTGIANFSGVIKDWSFIQRHSGVISYSDNKINLRSASTQNVSGITFNPTMLAQTVESGPFEVTTCISDFSNVNADMQAVGLTCINLNATIGTELNNKSIFAGLNTNFRAISVETTNGVTPAGVFDTISTKSANYFKSGFGTLTVSAGTAGNAWDGNTSTYWNTGVTNSGSIRINFTSPQIVNEYAIIGSATIASSPNSWRIEASSDTIDWITLGTVTGQNGWTDRQKRYYGIQNDTAYLYYRLTFTAGNGNAIELAEIEMYNNKLTRTTDLVRLKLTRDENNIVRSFYSLDAMSINDASANWILVGGNSYVLSGRLYVGLTANSFGATGTREDFSVSDFRFNSGILDKKIQCIYLGDSVVNDARVVSKHGTVATLPNGNYSVMLRNSIRIIDSNTFEELYRRSTHQEVHCGYMHSDLEKSSIISCPYQPGMTYKPKDTRALTPNVFQFYIYEYEPITNEFVWTWNIPNSCFAGGGVDYDNRSLATVAYDNLLWSTRYGDNLGGERITCLYGWRYQKWAWHEQADKFIKADFIIGTYDLPARQASSDWVHLIDDIEVKCNNFTNPLTINSSFSNLDRYDFITCRNGIAKDNQQFVTGIAITSYFCTARRTKEIIEIDGPGDKTYTISEKANNPSSFIMMDTGNYFSAIALNPDGSYKYFNNLANHVDLNISSVINQSTFRSDAEVLVRQTDFYRHLNRYVLYNGERRKILNYNGLLKEIVTEPFTTPIIPGTTFTIQAIAGVSRATGHKVTPSLTSANDQGWIIRRSGEVSGSEAWKAFDVNTGTGWQSNTTTGWIEFEASELFLIHSIGIHQVWTWSGSVNLDYYNGTTWVTHQSFTGITLWGGTLNTLNLSTGMQTPYYTRWRLNFHSNTNGQQLYMYEIYPYGWRVSDTFENKLIFNETNGTIFTRSGDVGSKYEIEYTNLHRSW